MIHHCTALVHNMPNAKHQPNVALIGSGEYVSHTQLPVRRNTADPSSSQTTGWVGGTDGKGSTSDKSVGVVGLVSFDLRRRGLLGDEISIVGTNGDKFSAIRDHFKKNIEGRYKELDTSFVGFPQAGKRDPEACELCTRSIVCSHSNLTPGQLLPQTRPRSTS